MEITRKAAWISLIASILILAMKYVAYLKTGSSAILSDALESIVNVVAASVALRVMTAVAEPADAEHPYGHGKLEFFSAAFEGGLITFAGIIIAAESVRALWIGKEPQNLDIGLGISLAAAIFNFVLGYFLLRTGKQKRSDALIASGEHVLSDVWSTAGAFLGLGLVYVTGISQFDPIAALVIAGNLMFAGFKIARRSVGALIDEVEPESLNDLAMAFQKNRRNGVIDIHLVKVIRSGRFHHVDGHLVVPEFWQIAETHDLMEEFEKDVVRTYPFDGEINFHLDPCEQSYCSVCSLQGCPIRLRPCLELRPFTASSVVDRPQKDFA